MTGHSEDPASQEPRRMQPQAETAGASQQWGQTMSINLTTPEIAELKPRIIVFGCGGAGGNAVNNMITSGLDGVDFVVANTDAQALSMSKSERVVQMGLVATEGLGAGSYPEVGAAAADEVIDEIRDHLQGAHMVFITAGMGGGTGTGAAPVVAKAARDMGILTVGVVTKPFMFEGQRRMRTANQGIEELQGQVDTLICIPNQNLFRIANEKTTFADAFSKADEVLYSGVACITDLMVKEGLINLDFADVRSVMHAMGRAMMGTGEASGEDRAMKAAEAAIANPLLDETSISTAGGVLISITGGNDLTLFEVDAAATRIREEVDHDANIILGATFDESLEGVIRVSVVATGIEPQADAQPAPQANRSSMAAQASRPTAAKTEKPAGITTPHQKNDLSTLDAQLRAAANDALQDVNAVQRPAAGPAPRANPAPASASHAAAPGASSVSVAGQDVTVSRARPADMASSLPPEPAPQPQPEPEPLVAETYVPPAPQRPETQSAPSAQAAPYPPVPRIDDFPPHAQAQYEAHQQAQQRAPEAPQHEEPQRRPGLFERIASGLQRRDTDEFVMSDEPTGGAQPHRPSTQAPMQGQAPTQGYAHAPAQSQPGALSGRIEPGTMEPQQVSEADYAKKPLAPRHESAVQQGQRRGPSVSVQPQEDDQYEIPAFLRRQNG
jgi:cell division protein FtsZ